MPGANDMNSDNRVNYEELVENYNKNLFETLRGFRAAEFLDTWVPDEDHEKSILNLIEAAQIAGMDSIILFIGSDTADSMDLSLLKDQASKMGDIQLKPGDKGMDLEVLNMKSR